MVLAQGLGARRCVGIGLAVWCAAVDVMHGVPRVVSRSMPDGTSQFQPAGCFLHALAVRPSPVPA
jgi:hypothetical protein